MPETSQISQQRIIPQDIDTSKPMDLEFVNGFMLALDRCEECGDWDAIEYLLDGSTFCWIRRFADEQLLQRISTWHEKLNEAREYERVHGKGSLFLKDHPYNVAFAERQKRRDERSGTSGAHTSLHAVSLTASPKVS